MEETIKTGKYVELYYDLFEIDGKEEVLVYEGNAEDPEKIVYGKTPLMTPLEKDIEGLKQGDEFDIIVESKDAYGEYDPEMVITVEKSAFSEDGTIDSEKIYPGAYLPMLTAEGATITGLVKEVNDNGVVMDFNHPSAGKDMRFKGKILLVRDATEKEMNEASGCGCSSCGCEGGCEGGCE